MRKPLAVALLLASSALGEELPTPPAPPTTQALPSWSLGAGLTFFSPLTVSAAVGGLGGLGGLVTNTITPVTPSVSLERLFSAHFALGLGLEASVQSSSVSSPAQTVLPASGTVGLALSPRFTMTEQSAPVSFTLVSTAFVGYAGGSSALGLGSTGAFRSLSVGVGGGIAFELKLLERLSVRAQANLIRLSLSRTAFSVGDVAAAETISTTVSANVVPSPSIEVRLFF